MCKSRYLICSLAKKLTSLKFTRGISTCIDFGRFPPNQNWRPVLSFTISNWDLKYHKFVFSQNAESKLFKIKKKETRNLEGRIP